MRCNDKKQTRVPVSMQKKSKRHLHNCQVIRDYISTKYKKQISLTITSGYRTTHYNDVYLPSIGIKTAKGSYHKQAIATDLKNREITSQQLAEDIIFLMDLGVIDKGGVGLYDTFVHYDSRGFFVKWDNSKKYSFKIVIFEKIKKILSWKN